MKIKIVVNKIIPIEDFIALTFIPFVFVQKANVHSFNDVVNNHKHIYVRQQIEMLIVGTILATDKSYWPTYDEVLSGEVYIDGDTLKVKA